MNVEHLLDVFVSVDAYSVGAWVACAYFMRHLFWHKKRLVMLGPKIKGLPDDHRSKPRCLFQLSRLFQTVGNHEEYKRLLIDALRLWRERGDDFQIAETLRFLSTANTWLGLYNEGIPQAKEALEIYERLNHIPGQARFLQALAPLLYLDKQLDTAEEAALRAIDFSDKGSKYLDCECYRFLGKIYHSKGETEKAIKHFETSIGIASSFNWHNVLFWNNYGLAGLFFDQNRFDDAHAHVERAKSHAIGDSYLLGRALELQARFWYRECRFEEAKSEALRAAGVFEGIGATRDVDGCKAILQNIEEETDT